ncbi:hypothetical protein KKG24_01250 [Patescibacteria group bacterium]|nr:hypothetical protein [Patescibacteria group bacterium]
MEQKTKFSILAVLVIIIIVSGAYLFKGEESANQPSFPSENSQALQKIDREINGKIRSINEKAVYVELEDGNGFAIGISSSTFVVTQGISDLGTLADLKEGQSITASVDVADNAIQILIKK